MTIIEAMTDAEHKAWDSLARYKFWMFGYHAAQWVMLNRLDPGERKPNPFRELVAFARSRSVAQAKSETAPLDAQETFHLQ